MMKSSDSLAMYFLTLFLLIRVEALVTNNIDVQEPFVIKSPATTEPDDAFGWSAIFHQTADVTSSDTLEEALAKTTVLVGAPRGTFPPFLTDPELPRENITGLVYSCSLATIGSCNGVRGNTSLYIGGSVNASITNARGDVSSVNQLFPRNIAEGRLFDQAPNARFSDLVIRGFAETQVEYKTGQLMGSHLFSDGNQVVGCAPQWNYVDISDPPASDQRFSKYIPKGICFVGNRDLQGFVSTSPCLGNDPLDDQCHAGTSAVLANNNVYVGAPIQSLNFFGATFTRPSNSAAADNGFSNANGLSSSSYYGFEMATGSLDADSTKEILVGATGYADASTRNARVGGVFLNPNPGGNPTLLVTGKQPGEAFGYSIVLVDLDGDGLDELVVGAPMYSTLEATRFSIERGRVFVFWNTGSGNVNTTLNTTAPTILMGGSPRIRFGMKVANAGDLDADGISDLIVSAPYETSGKGSQSTGAIYVYQGNRDRIAFGAQSPFKVHADNITAAVNDLTTLRTFGFSVSGQVDIDFNQHADLVVGGYLDQAVIVLRTRPFADVQVEFDRVPEVNLSRQNSFNVTITANYSSRDMQLSGMRQFMFQLREVVPAGISNRLYFTFNNSADTEFSGTFDFNAQQVATATVTVFLDTSGDPSQPYELVLSLVDAERSSSEVNTSGRRLQNLINLPRYRLTGTAKTFVNISDLCNDDNCQSDIVVGAQENNITIVAGQDRSIAFGLTYSNAGPEEARNLELVITDVPPSAVGNVQIAGQMRGFNCDPAMETPNGLRNVTCSLEDRLNVGEFESLTVTIPIRSVNIGNEEGFTLGVRIQVDAAGDNSDINPTNNAVNISYTVVSRSEISVTGSFPQAQVQYTADPPSGDIVRIGQLGLAERYTVRISNAGPSTIQSARVTIYFPAKSAVTGNNFFLYPAGLSPFIGTQATMDGTMVTCDEQNIDTQCLAGNGPNCNSQNNRKKRLARIPRQEATTNGLNCDTLPMDCLMFVCTISTLTTSSVDVILDYSLDERFFSSQMSNMRYNLTALARVEILTEFQQQNDNPDNDRAVSSVLLVPPVVQGGRGATFYVAIIVPTVIGVLLIIGFAILLYCVGFFRRKKREDDDDGELEEVQPMKPPPPNDEDTKL